MNSPIPTRLCCVCGKPTNFMQFVEGNVCSKEHYSEALNRQQPMTMTQFLDEFSGRVCFRLSKEDAEAAVALGREACDRYERVKLIDIFYPLLHGKTKAQIIDELTQRGMLHSAPGGTA